MKTTFKRISVYSILFLSFVGIGNVLAEESTLTTITQSGYFRVFCGEVEIDRHYSYRKALQSAVNNGGECYIKSPEYKIITTIPECSNIPPLNDNDNTDNTATIVEVPLTEVTIEPPTTREDGSPLSPNEEIKYYTLYASWNGGNYSPIWKGKSLKFKISLLPGSWKFYATATDMNGLESDKGNITEKRVPLDVEPNP
jgi:hypothetical protein